MPAGGKFNPIYNDKTEDAIEILRRADGRAPFKGPFRQDDLDRLWKVSDAYGKWVYRTWNAPRPKSATDAAWDRLMRAMETISHDTPGYLLGGGHGVPLASVSTHQRLDCSSSSSLALYEAGMFPHRYAIVSSQFENWGLPGPGKLFTVYANWEHVWIRLHRGRYWRFDTSPHGDTSGAGPRLRYLPRFSGSFVARHWKGM
jgi:hypothetical protein